MRNKNIRSLLSLAFVFTIIFPLASCTRNPDKISVRLKWLYLAGFSGDMVALKKDIFKKNGLEVTINEGGFNLDPIKLVASGSDQFGIAGPERVMLAQEEGLPLVAIATIYQSSPVVFVAKKGSGIRTPQDFIGRKVGIKPGTEIMMIYQAMLKKSGIDRSQIEEIPIQYSLIPFLEGQIDVHPTYLNNEPLQLDKMGVEYIIIDPKDYGVDLYGMCYFTTKKMIEQKPKVVECYLKSVLEGYRWALEHKDEATQIVLSFSDKLDPTVQRKMLDVIEPLLTGAPGGRIGWMDKAKWEATQKIYFDVGLLKKKLPLDSIYTNRFVKEIYK